MNLVDKMTPEPQFQECSVLFNFTEGHFLTFKYLIYRLAPYLFKTRQVKSDL